MRDNVRFPLRARGARTFELADTLLTRFDIGGLADRSPRTLSGGERQRVALARALASRPALLLLDEPLSSLDQPSREELRGVLQELLGGLQIPAIHVTHDRDEALIIGDELAIIMAGRIHQVADTREIAANPADATVAPLLGWLELGSGDAERGHVTVGELRLATARLQVGLPEGPVRVFYRPEGVVLGADVPGLEGTRFEAPVERIVPTAPLARITLGSRPAVTVLVLHRDLKRLGIERGARTLAGFLPESLRVFQ